MPHRSFTLHAQCCTSHQGMPLRMCRRVPSQPGKWHESHLDPEPHLMHFLAAQVMPASAPTPGLSCRHVADCVLPLPIDHTLDGASCWVMTICAPADVLDSHAAAAPFPLAAAAACLLAHTVLTGGRGGTPGPFPGECITAAAARPGMAAAMAACANSQHMIGVLLHSCCMHRHQPSIGITGCPVDGHQLGGHSDVKY